MSALAAFNRHMAECPLLAVIRGVTPMDARAVGEALYDAGVRIIEVPLNSPDPLQSIRILADHLGDRATIGAGTVLDPDAVDAVKTAGGSIVVSPNTRSAVIEAVVRADMVSVPGYFTPTEALAALHAGAHALKLFPAEAATPAVLKAQRAVLPAGTRIIVVGGVKPDDLRLWLDAGAAGFGIGSGFYRPGQPPDQVREQARAYVAALQR